MDLDDVDIRILRLYLAEPKAGIREFARRLGIARGTVQNRLDKLVEAGVITTFAPTLNPLALGFPLSADIHVTLQQRQLDEVVRQLRAIPYILRADSMAGPEDISCRVIARDHEHLERISVEILAIEGVERTRSDIVLRRRIDHRIAPLLDALGAD